MRLKTDREPALSNTLYIVRRISFLTNLLVFLEEVTSYLDSAVTQ